MAETNPMQRPNVQRQLAIFEVAKGARGKSIPEIKEMLLAAFARRRLPSQPGTWLDGVASEAQYGEPYIVDLPAAVAADSAVSAPDPLVHKSLVGRRKLRQAEGLPAGQDRASGATTHSGTGNGPADAPQTGTGSNRGPAVTRDIVAAAVALALAVSVAMAIRAARRRHGPPTRT